MPTRSRDVNPGSLTVAAAPTPPATVLSIVATTDDETPINVLDSEDFVTVQMLVSASNSAILHEATIDKQTGDITITTGGRAYPRDTTAVALLADFMDLVNRTAINRYGHLA